MDASTAKHPAHSLSPRPLSHADYTAACLCPMGVELAPVEAMLDEIHTSLPTSRSLNAYTLGRIGSHNIVVAAMPQIGNNAAAMVATQLLNDFPSIRFALLVGIGGGIPSQDGEDGGNDVRLGDIVVSQPTGAFGGVVQYDLGKVTVSGRFERTGSLGKPPAVLSTNVERLKAKHRREGSRIPELLSQMLVKYPRLGIDYAYPGTAQDQLFKATYAHQYGPTCQHCDPLQLVSRSERIDKAPLIHYGTIGSANAVIKDAATRDRLKQDVHIICVEMEAAGLMDTFPCLVVRGICDYADSHKNQRWQPYAAAVAAAYMKELLSIIPAQDVLQTFGATQITEQLRAVSLDIDRRARTEERKEILSWISSQSFAAKHQDLLAIRCEGTCEWFFKEPLFESWKHGSVNFLWCYGMQRRQITLSWHPFGTVACRFTRASCDLAQLRLSLILSYSVCSGSRSPSLSFSSAVLSPVSGPRYY